MKITKAGTYTVIKIVLIVVGCTIFVWLLWRKGPSLSENNNLSDKKRESKRGKEEKKKDDTKIPKDEHIKAKVAKNEEGK